MVNSSRLRKSITTIPSYHNIIMKSEKYSHTDSDSGEPLLEPFPSNQKPKTEAKTEFPLCSTPRTLFNIVNSIMGLTILTLPYTMSCMGWLFGTIVLTLYTLGSIYTAILIAKILEKHKDIRHYVDIGEAAFGLIGKTIMTTDIMLEVFALEVVLLMFIGSNLSFLFGVLDLKLWTLIGFIIPLITLWLKTMKHLSYLSFLGISSVFFLLIVLLIQGFYLDLSPGSILKPMPTLVYPKTFSSFPIPLGIIISALVAHPVYVYFYREMEHKKSYNKVMIMGYIIVYIIYFLISAIGYLMYGDYISTEITQNLNDNAYHVPEWIRILGKIATGILTINPICRYALQFTPMISFLEEIVLRRFGYDVMSDNKKWGLQAGLRTIIGSLSLICAVYIPSVINILTFVGSILCFFGSIIFPSICYLKLFRNELSKKAILINAIVLFFALFSMIMGTLWSIYPSIAYL
jgi:amino acid permease